MISAIILAAGKSTRMSQNKLLMKWGNVTVLEKVIQTVQSAGIEDIILVTTSEISKAVIGYEVRIIINESNQEMLSSIQLGLQSLLPPPSLHDTSPKFDGSSVEFGEGQAEATLITLGDQPQIEERSVRAVCEAYQNSKSNLVVPSYQMRRGHPWLVARPLWDEILKMKTNQSPRDFLNAHTDEIEYVDVDTPTILQDLDTPEDYLKYKPNV